MNSFFKNLHAKKKIESLYQNKLDELPIRYELINVETSFGNANIILTGETNKQPLVLLHGTASCAPNAIEAMIGLTNHFRIYAIDIVGQPNLSSEIRPPMQDNSYGQWMFEILTRLNLWDTILVGFSFGGFVSWKTLVFDDRRISEAFLIVPAGIINASHLQVLAKIVLPAKLYKWQKKGKHLQQVLQQLLTEIDEFSVAFLSEIFMHFDIDYTPPPLITVDQAKQIKIPINIIAADHDTLFPGDRLLSRSQILFPSLAKTLLLTDSRHVPDKHGNLCISDFIKICAS